MPEPSDRLISVLLPVHRGVTPGHLRSALTSILGQTRPADEIVVVEDGPLRSGHDVELDSLARRHPSVVRVRLPSNRGAGIANQAGLEAATGTWIAKADADDLLLPNRIERQLQVVESADLDVCGAAMLEFDGDPTIVVSLRSMPESHEKIARRMRSNNPINHPTAFYRRELALAVGGYPDMRFMQDYGLFARMLAGGARMHNLAEPLVLFRAGGAVSARRRDPRFRRLERELQQLLVDTGVVGPGRAKVNLMWRRAYRRMPEPVVALVQRRVLASRPDAGAVSNEEEST